MKKLLYLPVIAILIFTSGTTFSAEPLVDAAWVKANIGKAGTVFLDVRHPRSFAHATVPGAVNTSFQKDGWRVKLKDVPDMLPPTDKVEKLIGRLGIANEDHVVILPGGYSAGEMGVATRIYWTFKVIGHDAVSILDGGMEAYMSDKKAPLARGGGKPQAKPFKGAFRPELLATEADIAEFQGVLVDNRPNDQYVGVNKSGSVKKRGTLSGAKNVPGKWMAIDDGGRFRSVGTLKKLYEAVGVATDRPVINFCNTGHWASVGWFVTHELFGNAQSKLYDGSMAEWTRKGENPVEQVIPVD